MADQAFRPSIPAVQLPPTVYTQATLRPLNGVSPHDAPTLPPDDHGRDALVREQEEQSAVRRIEPAGPMLAGARALLATLTGDAATVPSMPRDSSDSSPPRSGRDALMRRIDAAWDDLG